MRVGGAVKVDSLNPMVISQPDHTHVPMQLAARTRASGDLKLVHAAQNGDLSAFERLVERYDRKLHRVAHHITNNREDSEDVVQEAFLKAYQHLDKFREESAFSTWLTRITVNQALMKLRKRRTIKELSLEEDLRQDGESLPHQVADWAPNPEELFQTSELRETLNKALGMLRPILRIVFALRDIEGFTTDQTAEVLGLSRNAVKARLWRARLQLRVLLSDYFAKHFNKHHERGASLVTAEMISQ